MARDPDRQLPPSGADQALAQLLHAQVLGTVRESLRKAPGAAVRRYRIGQPQLSTAAGKLVGWAFAESSGTNPASLRLWDGNDNSGDLLLPLLTLNAGESARDFLSHGIGFDHGVFLELVSGNVEAAVYIQ